MCHDARVKLAYLPLYSLDLNPIKEFFAELKSFIKRHWKIHEADLGQGFDVFLEWCIDVVGGNERGAGGHLRHSGLDIEHLTPHPERKLRIAGK